jgi:hypothetical protein
MAQQGQVFPLAGQGREFTAPEGTLRAPRSAQTFVGHPQNLSPTDRQTLLKREPGPRSACPSGSRRPLRATRLASPSLRRRCSVGPGNMTICRHFCERPANSTVVPVLYGGALRC